MNNHTNQKGFINVVIIILIVAIAGTIGYFALVKKPTPSNETNQPQQTNTPVTPETPTTKNNPTVTPPPATPQNVTQKNVDDCNLISNSSFQSINQYEAGLGPNGPAMGYWDIQFQKGTTLSNYGEPTFQWGHSDVSESGTYTCKENVLQVKFSDHSITAHYDGAKKILTWDGVEYKKFVVSTQWIWENLGCGSSAPCSYRVCSTINPKECYSCVGKYDKLSGEGEKTPEKNENPQTTTNFVCRPAS